MIKWPTNHSFSRAERSIRSETQLLNMRVAGTVAEGERHGAFGRRSIDSNVDAPGNLCSVYEPPRGVQFG